MKFIYRFLSGWDDSNIRPPRPERGALANCATPRLRFAGTKIYKLWKTKKERRKKRYFSCKIVCYYFFWKKVDLKLGKFKKLFYICTRKNDGAIAQLVEQRTENPCVPGSIPGGTTFKRLKIK